MNVAIASGGMVGGDAEGNDFARIGRRIGLRAKTCELLSVLEHMVGGEHGDDRLRIARGRPSGPGADSGGAIAPVRLKQGGRLGADLPQLLGDAKSVVEIGDDDRRIEHSGIADHADDRLKGRTLPDQGNELLGQAFPRFGPHAGAGPAAHDHRQNLVIKCTRVPGIVSPKTGLLWAKLTWDATPLRPGVDGVRVKRVEGKLQVRAYNEMVSASALRALQYPRRRLWLIATASHAFD